VLNFYVPFPYQTSRKNHCNISNASLSTKEENFKNNLVAENARQAILLFQTYFGSVFSPLKM